MDMTKKNEKRIPRPQLLGLSFFFPPAIFQPFHIKIYFVNPRHSSRIPLPPPSFLFFSSYNSRSTQLPTCRNSLHQADRPFPTSKLPKNELLASELHTVDSINLIGFDSLPTRLLSCRISPPVHLALDGRSMSGDIGRGATREAIDFAMRLAALPDRPHGFYQLAGGTNLHTIDSLKKVGLFKAIKFSEHGFENTSAVGITDSVQALIGGVAYGGYARKIIGRVLCKLPTQPYCVLIEDYPEYLMEALTEALTLVGPVKSYKLPLACTK